jgi:hypothetical protein
MKREKRNMQRGARQDSRGSPYVMGYMLETVVIVSLKFSYQMLLMNSFGLLRKLTGDKPKSDPAILLGKSGALSR